MEFVLFALWFFLPAGMANMAPIFANKIPGLNQWNTPMDFGKSLRGKRIFGDNKTWRGLFSGALVGGLTGLLVHALRPGVIEQFRVVSFIPAMDAFVIGLLLGVGALVGDAVESFFKRQLDIKPGHSWFPFDQTDYIIGGLLLSAIVVHLPWFYYPIILVIWFGVHLIFTYIGYLLKLRDRPI